MILNLRYTVVLFAAAAVCGGFNAQTAAAFDWPSGAALAQRLQVIKQEIESAKSLIASSQSKKPISAASYLAVNISDGAVLLQKYPDRPRPIASVTKLMNAVVVLENIDTAKTITLNREMLAPEGGSPCLFNGLNISARNLLQASLTQSVNDASESLARSLGKEKFLSLMNQKAKELKMANTVYYDVHGLNTNNKSTASDLARLLSYIHKTHPEILAATKDNNFWLPDQNGTLLKFRNMNYFYSMPDFIGGKSGYLPAAKNTFAALFDINGKPAAVIVLGSSALQADTFKIVNQLKNKSVAIK